MNIDLNKVIEEKNRRNLSEAEHRANQIINGIMTSKQEIAALEAHIVELKKQLKEVNAPQVSVEEVS